MINAIQLNSPAKMLRDTVMNVEQLLRIQTDYSIQSGTMAARIQAAATAVLRLECRSEPVICALSWLGVALEEKHDYPEIERAERYVLEAWSEYVEKE